MWDALESVWLAAKDDPQRETHVVPIPYYYKNPDGSFGQMHYEGNSYPDYVITEQRKITPFYNGELPKLFKLLINNNTQIYNNLSSNNDGTAGQKIYDYVSQIVKLG